MIFSNASETRLAIWTGAAGLLAGAMLAGAIAMTHRQHAAAPIGHPELLPDPAALRYRYSTTPAADAAADTASMITALEARVQAMPSPFDYAELADLYFRRAKLDGDPEGYKSAEAMARRSLELLPAPNPAVLTLAKLADTRHDFREAIELAHRPTKMSAGAQIIIATAHLALGELAAAGQAADAAIA